MIKNLADMGTPPERVGVHFYDVDVSLEEPIHSVSLSGSPHFHTGEEVTLRSYVVVGYEECWEEDPTTAKRRYQVLEVLQDFEQGHQQPDYFGIINRHVVHVHVRRIGE